MTNYWNRQGIPHKGWTLIDVIDIREDGQKESETEYETCMMCGNEKIRYVHIVENEEVGEEFRVGCTCAEKMTEDYVNPGKREKELRNRAKRIVNWNKKQWKISKSGNFFLTISGNHLLIYIDKETNKYKIKIGDTFLKKTFEDVETAKMEIFKRMETLKKNEMW